MRPDFNSNHVDIPAVVLFRGNLCCVAIDIQPQSKIGFVYDHESCKLWSNHGRLVSFGNEDVSIKVGKLIQLNSANVAVIEFGAMGQVVREHEVKLGQYVPNTN